MPHRELSESSPGPELLELRDEGGNPWTDSGIAGGGGTLREAASVADAPETSEDLRTLTSRVSENATDISDALDTLDAAEDAKIRGTAAKDIARALGFLNAWMDHFYTHPAYKATEILRQEGLDRLLKGKNPQSVAIGIGQMRQFIAAVIAIDFAEAVEAPYGRLYSPESNAAFQVRRTAYEEKNAEAKRE